MSDWISDFFEEDNSWKDHSSLFELELLHENSYFRNEKYSDPEDRESYNMMYYKFSRNQINSVTENGSWSAAELIKHIRAVSNNYKNGIKRRTNKEDGNANF